MQFLAWSRVLEVCGGIMLNLRDCWEGSTRGVILAQ
jgi:hypothetical protein